MQPETTPDPVPAQLARIDQLSMVARTTWFGLLAYLAFVGVTLLGVEDADFFVPSRQTQLPLVNVSIPTSSFFWFAPMLGAALYAYLHLQLLKLWEALAKPPPVIDGKPLSEHVYPWLISDFALSQRNDDAITLRPLRLLSGWTTRLLVWWSAPLILGGFWWRSMPAHHEGMTLWIALCMMLTLYIGFTSRRKARIEMRRLKGNTPWQGWLRRPMFFMFCLFVLALSWARTEGGIDHRFNQLVTIWNDARPGWQIYRTCPDEYSPANNTVAYCFFANGEAKKGVELQEAIVRNLPLVWTLDDLTKMFDGSWLGAGIHSVSNWQLFPSTELAGVDFIPNPGDLLEHTTERRRFRKDWCGRQGIDLETCGRLYTATDPAPHHLAQRREAWCHERKIAADEDCLAFFKKLDGEFRQEWTILWNIRTAALGKLDLSGVDLRGADLTGAFLIGVDLSEARMEWADLSGARLEGAELNGAWLEGTQLSEARLEGAGLSGARMERADLSGARMERVNLWRARLEGANLWQARLEGAGLSGARMEGADLREARLEGADLREARMEGADLRGARMEGANLEEARMEGADLGEARMEGANLRRTRLEGADLSVAVLSGAILIEAELVDANFMAATLKRADLSDARLDRAVFGGVQMHDAILSNARLEQADFSSAQMERVDLRGARMKEAVFLDANLEDANLRGAHMFGADFKGAILRSADLGLNFKFVSIRGADLRSSSVFQAILSSVYGDSSTVLPDRMTRPDHWDDNWIEGFGEDPKFEAWLRSQREQE